MQQATNRGIMPNQHRMDPVPTDLTDPDPLRKTLLESLRRTLLMISHWASSARNKFIPWDVFITLAGFASVQGAASQQNMPSQHPRPSILACPGPQ